jgi:NADH-quinone oxidoreductase subunit C
VAALRARFGDAVGDASTFRGTHVVTVSPERLVEIMTYLRDDPGASFEMLLDVVTVDWQAYPYADGEVGREPRFDVVYNLLSMRRRHRLQVRVRVSEDEPSLPTLTGVWAGANWFEREAFDMMGIRFDGHPNLARILTHSGFSGHPLRKDYAPDRRQPPAAPPVVVPTSARREDR